MEEKYISFRKAKVGGFNKKDVITYIEKMRNDFFDYKKAVELTIDQLNAKVGELEAACEGTKEVVKEVIVEVPVPVEKDSDPLSDINEATSQLRLVADELCRSLSDFMSKFSEGQTVAAQESAKPEIFDNVSAYIEETAKEIFEEKTEESVEESADIFKKVITTSVNFSFLVDSVRTDEPIKNEEKNEDTILDCLSSCSFLG